MQDVTSPINDWGQAPRPREVLEILHQHGVMQFTVRKMMCFMVMMCGSRSKERPKTSLSLGSYEIPHVSDF